MLIEIGGQIQELDIGGRIHDDNLTLEAEFSVVTVVSVRRWKIIVFTKFNESRIHECLLL